MKIQSILGIICCMGLAGVLVASMENDDGRISNVWESSYFPAIAHNQQLKIFSQSLDSKKSFSEQVSAAKMQEICPGWDRLCDFHQSDVRCRLITCYMEKISIDPTDAFDDLLSKYFPDMSDHGNQFVRGALRYKLAEAQGGGVFATESVKRKRSILLRKLNDDIQDPSKSETKEMTRKVREAVQAFSVNDIGDLTIEQIFAKANGPIIKREQIKNGNCLSAVNFYR